MNKALKALKNEHSQLLKQVASLGTRIEKLSKPHRRPNAKGKLKHTEALIEALKKHRIMGLKELCQAAIKAGARTSNPTPEFPFHAILCRKPQIFRQIAWGVWGLQKGWERAYQKTRDYAYIPRKW